MSMMAHLKLVVIEAGKEGCVWHEQFVEGNQNLIDSSLCHVFSPSPTLRWLLDCPCRARGIGRLHCTVALLVSQAHNGGMCFSRRVFVRPRSWPAGVYFSYSSGHFLASTLLLRLRCGL